MSESATSNFSARLLDRLTNSSRLADAATGLTLSRTQLAACVRGFAFGLEAAGLRRGDHILIRCGLTPASAIAYLGALYGGLVAVPVSDQVLAASGETTLRKAAARAIWTEAGIECDWAERAGARHLQGPLSGVNGSAPASVDGDRLAALMLTSGSTGSAKLVQVSHGNLIANTEATIRSQRLASDDCALLVLPIHYCFGASVLHTHLYQGGGVVFDSRFMFPDKVLRAIDEYGCTTFAGVPTVFNILLRRSNLKSIPLRSLRRFLQAGGPLAPDRIRELREIVPHVPLYVMYGQTEATARIACLPPERLHDKLGSVGVPLDNLIARVVDNDAADVPIGQSGELWVRGPSICSGYFGEPEQTALKLHDGWLATGDIVKLDRDGYLWIVGRKSEFIKMRGIRVSFAEIEARVAAVPGVAECAASAVPHAEAGEAIALYVVAESGKDHELLPSIRRILPLEWICDSVDVVNTLPRNAQGKLMRPLLADVPRRHLGGEAAVWSPSNKRSMPC